MAKPPFVRGQAGTTETHGRASRREQQRAVEEGIDIVRDAIVKLMARPKEEREKQIEVLASELEAMTELFDSVKKSNAVNANTGGGARRLKATKTIIEVLRNASSAKP